MPAEDHHRNELRPGLDHLCAQPDRVRCFAGFLWALINTREFVLNH